ncbi:MAG: nucleoside 2-deoxyribosyltransferase [Clostridia bacterium]|nr:nucleoside 2-deoxyribosyltransferase [Clostridia bacterium]
MKIYLAASVFSVFERELNVSIAKMITELGGHSVFLPQEVAPPETEDGLDMEYIYKECRDHIDSSDAILAIVDGSDVDSGVAWELGYAFAKNVPSLCIRTDIRKAEHNGVNIMIEYGASKTIHLTKYHQKIKDVVDRIIEELEAI